MNNSKADLITVNVFYRYTWRKNKNETECFKTNESSLLYRVVKSSDYYKKVNNKKGKQ